MPFEITNIVAPYATTESQAVQQRLFLQLHHTVSTTESISFYSFRIIGIILEFCPSETLLLSQHHVPRSNHFAIEAIKFPAIATTENKNLPVSRTNRNQRFTFSSLIRHPDRNGPKCSFGLLSAKANQWTV